MDAAVPDDDGVVYRLIYRSRSRMPEAGRRAALGDLFTAARSHNKRAHITGALLVRGDVFVQTLEGDEDVVQALLGRIREDSRHDRIEVLETSLVRERVFARWSMARVSDQPDEGDVNLIAHADGISPAAPRGDGTAAQEAVLTVMREAARTDPAVPA
jgi:hypothetical protein